MKNHAVEIISKYIFNYDKIMTEFSKLRPETEEQ